MIDPFCKCIALISIVLFIQLNFKDVASHRCNQLKKGDSGVHREGYFKIDNKLYKL